MKKESGYASLPSAIRRGLRKSLASDKPFMLAPVNWAANKIFGKPKVNRAYWKYLQGPVAKADIALGSGAQKLTSKLTRGKLKGKMWEDTKNLRIAKPGKHTTGKQEVKIPSIMAPASKTSKFVIPLLGAMKMQEMLGGKKMSDNNKKPDLVKAASMLRSLHEENGTLKKEAKAMELLYKQAEMGLTPFPQTHSEYQEKVAELLGKDLNVVEEAMKLASSNGDASNLGNLGEVSAGNPSNAQQNFQQQIISSN